MMCTEGTYFHGGDNSGGLDLFVWVMSLCDVCAGDLKFV